MTSDHHKSSNKCSFCSKDQNQVELLIEKPGMFICDECVESFSAGMKDPDFGQATELHSECSFCSFVKTLPVSMHGLTASAGNKGRRLVRGPTRCICDDCLDVCMEIVDEHRQNEQDT